MGLSPLPAGSDLSLSRWHCNSTDSSDAQLASEDCLLVWGGLTQSLELGLGNLLEFLQRSIYPVLVVSRLKVVRKEHPWGAAPQQLRGCPAGLSPAAVWASAQ